MEKKTILIIVGTILLLGGIGFFAVWNAIMSDSVDVAFLTVEKQEVQVDQGNGWQKGIDGMKLSLNDKVKTTNGAAVVTLYESIIIELDEDTEISLKGLTENKVAIRQEKGSTWNKFTSLLGIQGYEVETPTTVATVRGTEFGVDVGEDTAILVGEGTVDAIIGDEQDTIEEFQSMVKKQGKKMSIQDMTNEDLKRTLIMSQKTLKHLNNLREHLIDKKRALINQAAKQYDATEGDLRSYLAEIDAGKIDDAELIEKSPVDVPAMHRLKKMNDEIKKQNALIQRIEAKLS